MNKLFISIFVAILLVSSVSATNWYVDNAVSTSGNGQSWSSAWKAFSNIQWSSIKPGDTLYISGGSSSKTYSEKLDIQASGSSGNLITIRRGLESGHNGNVIIDKNFASGVGLDLQGVNYVNVRDLHIQNIGDTCVYVRTAKYIYLDNLEVRNCNGQLIYLQGYTSEEYPWTTVGIDHFYLRNSIVEDLRTSPGAQTDVIAMYYAIQNVFIENNTLIVGNKDSTQHTDCIQWYWGVKDVTITGNWIENLGGIGAGAQNQAMMTGLSYGTIKIYNNVFYTPNFGDGVDPLAGAKGMNTIYAGTSQNARWEIVGNTFVTGNNSNLLFLENMPSIKLQNNIFYHLQQMKGSSVRYIGTLPSSWDEVSNNLYSVNTYGTKGTPLAIGYSGRTVAQFQSTYGAELNTITNQNPLFVNLANKDFHLQSSSPGINAGATIGAPYNIDKDGVSRPQGSAYDIGAYEYGSGGSTTYHPADLNHDGCISLGEISGYVGQWLNGQVTLGQASSAVSTWMGGC